MTLSFVVDMNLSAGWVRVLVAEGWHAVHWSSIGLASSIDDEIVAWARLNRHVVLTQDLDFGTILAITNADSPSIVLLRGEDVLPATRGAGVVVAIGQHESALIVGALVVIDVARHRVRLLPFSPRQTRP